MTLRIYWLAAALAVPGTVLAQEPTLRPLTEHIAGFESDSAGTARYVARRCAALYLLVADLSSSRDPELAEQYNKSVPPFLAMSARADQALGADTPEAFEATKTAIKGLVEVYVQRAKKNVATTGSYFAQDRVVGADMQVCKHIADAAGATSSQQRFPKP
ncbi:MAG TPA: hypothetical protein VK864_12080 [Longimicrobiales bacterium]|nr:hypothetical protein [Longimicrobiales bacterium]